MAGFLTLHTKEDVISSEHKFSAPTLATSEDLDEILGWLKKEFDEDGSRGFWGNRRRISEAFEFQELWVLRASGTAVAFQSGNYSAEYLSIRRDMRGMGLGRLLVEASLERAFRDDVNLLQVECEPKTSLGFWERMGFERWSASRRPIYARRRILRNFELPASMPRRSVSVEFYPRIVLYGSNKDEAQAFAIHSAVGAESMSGTIYLNQRLFEAAPRDSAVRIIVDGEELCFEEAKYDKAMGLGMRFDRYGGTYFIDVIRP